MSLAAIRALETRDCICLSVKAAREGLHERDKGPLTSLWIYNKTMQTKLQQARAIARTVLTFAGDLADLNAVRDAAYAIAIMASKSEIVGISTAATILSGLVRVATGEAKRQYMDILSKWQEMTAHLEILLDDLGNLGYCPDTRNLDNDVKAFAKFLSDYSNQGILSRTTMRTALDSDFMVKAITQYAAAITFSYTNVLTQAVLIMYAELRKANRNQIGGIGAPDRTRELKAFLRGQQGNCAWRQRPQMPQATAETVVTAEELAQYEKAQAQISRHRRAAERPRSPSGRRPTASAPLGLGLAIVRPSAAAAAARASAKSARSAAAAAVQQRTAVPTARLQSAVPNVQLTDFLKNERPRGESDPKTFGN